MCCGKLFIEKQPSYRFYQILFFIIIKHVIDYFDSTVPIFYNALSLPKIFLLGNGFNPEIRYGRQKIRMDRRELLLGHSKNGPTFDDTFHGHFAPTGMKIHTGRMMIHPTVLCEK